MDDEFICARCQSVLRPGKNNLVMVKIISISDPTAEQVAETISLEDIQQEIQDLLRRLEGISMSHANRENFSSQVLYFCKHCHGEWDENPVA